MNPVHVLKALTAGLIFVAAGSSTVANATLYVFATDPAEGAYGVAMMTSGPVYVANRIMDTFAGKAIVGYGGGVRHQTAPARIELGTRINSGASPAEIQSFLVQNYPESEYARVGYVTSDFTIGYHLPRSGCPTPECGVRVAENFLVIGGGLVQGVLDSLLGSLPAVFGDPKRPPLACRLLQAGAKVIAAGGEIKEFGSFQIVVDSPRRSQPLQMNLFTGKFLEADFIREARAQLASFGVFCP